MVFKEYEYENFGAKQKGQYSFNVILEWTSAEIWLYIYKNKLDINLAYKKGNSRAGCLVCPMSARKSDYMNQQCYKSEADPYYDIIREFNAVDKGNEAKSGMAHEKYRTVGVSRPSAVSLRPAVTGAGIPPIPRAPPTPSQTAQPESPAPKSRPAAPAYWQTSSPRQE